MHAQCCMVKAMGTQWRLTMVRSYHIYKDVLDTVNAQSGLHNDSACEIESRNASDPYAVQDNSDLQMKSLLMASQPIR